MLCYLSVMLCTADLGPEPEDERGNNY